MIIRKLAVVAVAMGLLGAQGARAQSMLGADEGIEPRDDGLM